MASVAYVTTHT